MTDASNQALALRCRGLVKRYGDVVALDGLDLEVRTGECFPARKSHLLGAQLISRLIFLIPEAGALLLFAGLLLGVPLRGSLWLLSAVSILGALAFSGLGLLTAARPRTIEGVSGIMNLVMVPMWVFSGIFFSTERFPAAIQPFIQALPLTALNDALRGVMLDGSGLVALGPELLLLAAWGVVSFALALKLFRWQ